MGSDQISLRAQNRTDPNAFQPSIAVPLLSCPVLSPPVPRSAPSAPPNHGVNGRAPPQRRRARGEAPAPLPPVVTAAATVWLPRNPGLSLPAPAAARGLGRERDERGQDGRGDHREVRPRVRPLENIQLQGGGTGRRRRREEEEVADRPGQGAPGQVRRRVPGHLHNALTHLLRALLRTHQRRRRRAGPARQGRDRDGRDRREGGHVRAGLRGAQGRVADQVPAHGGADAGGGQLDWQDQEGGRVMLNC